MARKNENMKVRMHECAKARIGVQRSYFVLSPLRVFALSLFIISLAACKDDNVPKEDKTPIEHEQLLGSWEIVDTEAYVNVDGGYKAAADFLDLEEKLKKRLKKLTENSGFHFEENNVYFFKYDGMLSDSSRYMVDENKIRLENTNLIDAYAPFFYAKFSGDLLVTYLRRSEVIELLKREDDMKSWIGLIESAVDDAQCELRFRRRATSYFDVEEQW